MRVSYNWLKEYVDFDVSPEELAKRITLAGLEVDEIICLGKGIENVVVGLVKEKKEHPSSQKLSVCLVDDGTQVRQVVCGAPNVAAGQKVPLAVPGAKLPDGIEISKAQVAGIESSGMICSESELGISDNHDGIMVLSHELELGRDVVEALALKDTVLVLGLTPNRSDCLGMLNVAREAAAVTGGTLHLPSIVYGEKGGSILDAAAIEVEDQDLCPRYLARLVQGVKIGPSPLWMQRCLIAAGMRPINNVVDISNFVMLETGQPSHIFDFQHLEGRKIIVRRSKPGEKMVTLDNKERTFAEDTLLICDGVKPVCIAGVMGGLESEVTEATTDVLIEAACFDPVSIRRTSRRLNLISESSLRFEKGIDVEGCNWASRRIVELLLEHCGGISASGCIDVRVSPRPETSIAIQVEKVNSVLGTDFSLDEIVSVMSRLGFPMDKIDDKLMVAVPYYRQDISIEEDLIEEIARIKGYDLIPVTLPASSSHGLRTQAQQTLKNLNQACIGAGLYEIVNYTFISPKDDSRLCLAEDHPWSRGLAISNPLSEDQSVMRTNLLAGVLQTAYRNYSRRNLDLRFFEIGACFKPKAEGMQPQETETLAIALSGEYNSGWQEKGIAYDYFYLKGIWESLALRFNLPECEYTAVDNAAYPFLHPGRSAEIICAGELIGFLGQVHPQVLANYELEKPLYYLQVITEVFCKHNAMMGQCEDLPRFPSALRDMALLGADQIPAAAITAEIREQGGENLRKVELFDLYDKAPIPQGQRSLAFRLTYQNPERTLTDEEINRSFDNIVDNLGRKWDLKLR